MQTFFKVVIIPVTRRVKGYTRFVGKYATGRRKLESWDLVCRFLSFLRSARLFQRCSPPTLMPTNAHNAKTRLASIFFIKQISNKFKWDLVLTILSIYMCSVQFGPIIKQISANKVWNLGITRFANCINLSPSHSP